MKNTDLIAIARKIVQDNGFEPDFSKEVDAEVAHQVAALPTAAAVEDLRSLLWSSIDNDDSKDLDQVEVSQPLEGGMIRIWVGVADVDSRVPKGSATDAHAALNTCTLYADVAIFPMLPLPLSTGLTSLNADQDRLTMVAEMDVAPNGGVTRSRICRALTRNHAQLAYDAVSSWLEGNGPVPPRVAAVPGMEQQLRTQNEASLRLKSLRHERGALDLESNEAQAVHKDGEVVGLTAKPPGRARELIEDFMIAANEAMAKFLREQERSGIARVVKTPKRWPRIVDLAKSLGETLPTEPDPRALSAFLESQKKKAPAQFADLSLSVVKLLGRGEYLLQSPNTPPEQHFGLAVQGYSHSTAPNRRYPDLLTQRLVKAAIANVPAPYRDDEISAQAAHCTEKEHDADKVERTMRKVLAAFLLQKRIGEVFPGVVTGASPKGIFVRITSPAAEGRVVQGEQGLDVGDAVRVKLVSVHPEKGFIDFARV